MTNIDIGLTHLDVLKSIHYSADKSPYNQGNGLPSGHVW